jgi:tetratricopeptide (TPR) repeat protein
LGPPAIKYRAFISYSHADSPIAEKVHRRLERFPIARDLIGRETSIGTVPKRLGPFFLDRSDFKAGPSLDEQTIAALDDSMALILIASPSAAKSRYVNEEIRLFRSRHPERACIPLIVDGAHETRECFPPAMRFKVSADGVISGKREDVPLAADLRKDADGLNLALSKIIATLLGLPTDEVFRRADRARRRQQLIQTAVAALVVLLLIVGGAAYWWSIQQGTVIADVEAIVAQYAGTELEEANSPLAGKGLAEAIRAIAEGAVKDPRYAKALELLRAQKPTEAEPLLKAVAEEKAKRAERDSKDAAAAYRNLAQIALVSDHKRAREYFLEAARLDDTDIEAMYEDGWTQTEAGNLEAGQKAYSRALELAKLGDHPDWAGLAQTGLGNIQVFRGNLDAAIAAYREAERILRPFAKLDPMGRGQMILASVYDQMGDVMRRERRSADALRSYRDSLNIHEHLAATHPHDTQDQVFLALSYDRIGRLLFAQGDLNGAEDFYRNSQNLRRAIATAGPDNPTSAGHLAGSDQEIGDIERERGDFISAIDSYGQAVGILERLARSDVESLQWQRNLAVAYEHISTMFANGGMKAEAFIPLQKARQIIARAATTWPEASVLTEDLERFDHQLADLSR